MSANLALWVLLGTAVFAAIVIGVMLWEARHRDAVANGAPETGAPVVKITGAIAAGYAVIALLFLVLGALQVLIGSSATWVTMPVEPFFPQMPEYITVEEPGPTGYVVDGGFRQAEVLVTGLPFTTRLLIACGSLLEGIVPVSIAALVALLCWRLIQGRAFTQDVPRFAMVAAAITLVCGFFGQVLSGWGASNASYDTLLILGWHAPVVPGEPDPSPGLPEPAFAFTVDFWPVFVALGLASLAVLLRYGSKLEAETKGLV